VDVISKTSLILSSDLFVPISVKLAQTASVN